MNALHVYQNEVIALQPVWKGQAMTDPAMHARCLAFRDASGSSPADVAVAFAALEVARAIALAEQEKQALRATLATVEVHVRSANC